VACFCMGERCLVWRSLLIYAGVWFADMGNISDVGTKALAKAGCGSGLRTLILGAYPSSSTGFELRASAVTCLPFFCHSSRLLGLSLSSLQRNREGKAARGFEWPGGRVGPIVSCACSLELCLAG